MQPLQVSMSLLIRGYLTAYAILILFQFLISLHIFHQNIHISWGCGIQTLFHENLGFHGQPAIVPQAYFLDI
jgi:hypothetical protein